MVFSSDQPQVSSQLSDFDLPDNYEDFSEIFDREYKRVVDVVNTKEDGEYIPEETATFQTYFDSTSPTTSKNVYRKLIQFGALPATATKSVAHGVTFTSASRVTRLYGGATNPTGKLYIPLPASSPTLVNNIALTMDATNVIVVTGADFSAYTATTIVMEYTKG